MTLRLPPAVAGARLIGLGSVQPTNIVTNDDLAKTMDTNDQWIRERVGIQSRPIIADGTTLVEMAAEAGTLAVKDSGLEPDEIDTVIFASCTMPARSPTAPRRPPPASGSPRPPRSTSTPPAPGSATASAPRPA